MAGIRDWLEGLDLGEYAEAFETEKISPEDLTEFTENDLGALGLPMGPRRRVLKAVRASSVEASPESATPAVAPRAAERRQITVMFCDLVGSTGLAEALDPEDLRSVMQAYQAAAGGVIERYGGHVAQYLGDGLMTYFGWPQAHEDDAERAVRAGLEIVGAVKSVEAPAPLQVRVGIAMGPVVVGETGAGDASVPKLAVGETPNLAARLQGLAAADAVIVGPSTRRLLGGTFELDDLGAQTLKGIVEPVPAWRATGVAATEGRFEAQHQHLTPLVGREAEMAMVMARWEQAKSGEGQVIVLSGEPGIGKSRITQALRDRVVDAAHTRLRYQCSPYHTNSALHPIIEQFERAAGFARDDTVETKLDKLEALVTPSGTKVALFAALLSLPMDRYPALGMSPQKQKEETLKALADQVLLLAAAQPVLLIFEDAHWIDPTSQEALDQIVPALAGHPVLAVITHRPEYDPPWLGQAHVAPLALTRLGRADAAAMVARVSDTPLPDEILDQIVAKTDGVPLFVEELTKTVIESGADTANAIPETLQDSLMARLDRLAPVREVAQIGACIGREFGYELLAAVSPLGDNALGEALQQLVNAELIHHTGNTYTFKHALVQNAAYESLLKSRRQQLHFTIAESYQELYADKESVAPEILAHHFEHAGRDVSASGHWRHAGQLSLENSALIESVAYFRKGLACVDRLPASDDKLRLEYDARTALGTAIMSLSGWPAPELKETLEPAWDLAKKIGASVDPGGVLGPLCMNSVTSGDISGALRWVDEILRLADERNDTGLDLLGCMAGVICHFWHGDFAAVNAATDQISRNYDKAVHGHLVDIHNHDPVVIAHIYAGHVKWILGYPDAAATDAREAVTLAETQGHPFNLGFALGWGAGAFWYRGDIEALRKREKTLIRLANDHAMPFLEYVQAGICRSEALLCESHYDRAIDSFNTLIQIWSAGGGGLVTAYWLLRYSQACVEAGELDKAEDAIERVLGLIDTNNERWAEAEALRVKGEVLSRKSPADITGAEETFGRALDIARTQFAKSWELRAATSLARLWQDQGKTAEARELLAPVYDWFTEGFDTPDLVDAKALLDALK